MGCSCSFGRAFSNVFEWRAMQLHICEMTDKILPTSKISPSSNEKLASLQGFNVSFLGS